MASYPSDYYAGYRDSTARYPDPQEPNYSTSARDPFADESFRFSSSSSAYDPTMPAPQNGHNNSSLYPPQTYSAENRYTQSSDSIESADGALDGNGFGSGKEFAKARRDESTNPYAAGYKGDRARSRRKWAFIGVAILVIIGIAIGIGVWRATASSSGSASSSSSTSSKGGLSFIDGTAKAVRSNANDPSQFEKDPRCGATLANVTEDVQQISQLTTRLRMYGSACNQSELVLEAIRATKVDLNVFLGVFIGPNSTVNEQQKTQTLQAIEKYAGDRILGVTVSNEYILNQVDQLAATNFIVEQAKDFSTRLANLRLSQKIPVGVADAGSVVTTRLAQGAEFVMSNIHPWFAGVPVEQAADWVQSYNAEFVTPQVEAATNKPTEYTAEVGWPTASMTTLNATLGAAVVGIPQLQTFLDTYVCEANRNGTKYFYFAAYDEPWKEMYGGVEPYWGLFQSDKKLKSVTLPNCV